MRGRMFIGIDVGSRTAKGVLFDGKMIVGSAICDSDIQPKYSSQKIFDRLLESAKVKNENIKKIVGTGYGRVSLEITDKTVTELSCHAKGAHFVCPTVRTVIDIGGQDSKVIHVNSNGGMKDFAMNDKCAAGTGRFFEIAARALGMDLPAFCNIQPNVENNHTINNMCAVFAETEIISLLAKEIPVETIASGINTSFAQRIAGLAKRLGVYNDVLFVGGVAKNEALKQSVGKALGLKFAPLEVDPQLMGALGAAIYASQL